MSHGQVKHPYGKPECILKFTTNNKVENNLDAIIKLLQHEKVKNRKIVVFSIIGAYRKGKSFFLDYCLRYMYANYSSIKCPNNYEYDSHWMGKEDEPLAGFSWRSGSTRDTTGIIIWNDIFLHTDYDTDDEIAIIVMDTQGLFDNETSSMDNSRIFALGTLISSIQVLNLSNVIQEDQLQYLQFATEFARFAAKDCHKITEKPFQNLTFLIRDWQNNDEYPFGVEGGDDYLNKMLQIKNNQSQELKNVRRSIQTSFEEISCSLLPYPGRTVAEGVRKGVKYDGNWSGMNEDFKDELEKTIEHLLDADNISKWTKKINGKDVKGSEFLEYIKLYFKLMQSEQLPKVQSIYESLIEKEMSTLIVACVQRYSDIVSKNKSVITSVEHIPTIHESSKSQSICMYMESKKMGDAKHEDKYRKILEEAINLNYKYWKNESEANIRKIEMENKKIQDEIKLKHKRDYEKIKKEKRRMEKSHKNELKKLQISLEKLKVSKNDEIAKLKKQVKEEKEAQEREFRVEKLKVRMELERERVKKDAEIAELKQQLEQQKEALEKEAEIQRLNRELEIQRVQRQSTNDQIQVQNLQSFQIRMVEGSSHSLFGNLFGHISFSDSDSD